MFTSRKPKSQSSETTHQSREIKQVLLHPYKYNDIAKLDMGRRVQYNWDIPISMDSKKVAHGPVLQG